MTQVASVFTLLSMFNLQGGRHVDYVTDMIVKSLGEALKKKNKSGVQIKPFQVSSATLSPD